MVVWAVIRRRVRARHDGGGVGPPSGTSHRCPLPQSNRADAEDRPACPPAGRSSRSPTFRSDATSRTRPPGARPRGAGWPPRQTPCGPPSGAAVSGTSREAAADPFRHGAWRRAAEKCSRSLGDRVRTGGTALTGARPPSFVRPSWDPLFSRRPCGALT
jgi:hypothetical protein